MWLSWVKLSHNLAIRTKFMRFGLDLVCSLLLLIILEIVYLNSWLSSLRLMKAIISCFKSDKIKIECFSPDELELGWRLARANLILKVTSYVSSTNLWHMFRVCKSCGVFSVSCLHGIFFGRKRG